MSNQNSSGKVPYTYEEPAAPKDHLKWYSSIDWSKFMDVPQAPNQKAETTCECGAFKTSGFKKGQIGHSDWCPWSK